MALPGIVVWQQAVRQLPHLEQGAPRTRRICEVLTVADLLVLVLRVLPGKLRERLNVERDRPGKSKEGADTSGSACEDPGSGQARPLAGNVRLFVACEQRARASGEEVRCLGDQGR
jgi:hypothetical protein